MGNKSRTKEPTLFNPNRCDLCIWGYRWNGDGWCPWWNTEPSGYCTYDKYHNDPHLRNGEQS